MKKLDYIIVGFGIAGMSCCEHLLRSGKDFMVLDHPFQSATMTAGGIVNPVVLKRFTAVWKAQEFLEYATTFYRELEKKIASNFISETNIFRVFASYEEQNQWLVAGDKKELSSFLSTEIYSDPTTNWNHTFGYGKVHQAFQIDTKQLFRDFARHLSNLQYYRREVFDYKKLEVSDQEICYGDLMAQKIIFSEGVSVKSNPFFPKQAILPKKGEYITIHAPGLQLKSVLKGPFFVIPIGSDQFKVGATFAQGDDTQAITENGRTQLVLALQKILQIPFEVIEQEYGFRPTVKDRKPILGNVPDHENIYFLNGLGTKGLLMAPLLAKWLLEYSEDQMELLQEINIKRLLNQPFLDRI